MLKFDMIRAICAFNISQSAKVFLIFLVTQVTMTLKYSNKQIGDKIGLEKRQVQRIIEELEQKKLIWISYCKLELEGSSYHITSRTIYANADRIEEFSKKKD